MKSGRAGATPAPRMLTTRVPKNSSIVTSCPHFTTRSPAAELCRWKAQRLGLESYASDLNPVAVLINKAMIEIPPKFAGKPPVNPEVEKNRDFVGREWKGAQGLAEDVRYYGKWMRDEAEKRIGHLYPKVEVTTETAQERPDLKKYVGQELTVIAWLWARTVKSPNPAFANVDVPLASTFMLSKKKGNEAYVEPVIARDTYRFMVRVGRLIDEAAAKNGTKLSRGANFRCIMSGAPIGQEHIRGEFKAKRASARLMAIVADGQRERVYLAPTREMEAIACNVEPAWRPEVEMNQESKDLLSGRGYGFEYWYELFTSRQLTTLGLFSELVREAHERVKHDASSTALIDDTSALEKGGVGATAYADAVCVYLGFAIDKAADYNSSLVLWSPTRNQVKTTFSRQALPMVWDFAETNVFANAAGDVGVRSERHYPNFGIFWIGRRWARTCV